MARSKWASWFFFGGVFLFFNPAIVEPNLSIVLGPLRGLYEYYGKVIFKLPLRRFSGIPYCTSVNHDLL